MKKWQANIGLLIVAMIWGGSFLATDNMLEFFTPLNLQIYRNIFATIILIAVFFNKFKSINKRTVMIGILFGVLFLASNTVQSIGLQYTTVSKNAFLTANYVIFIPLIAFIFFRQVPTKFVIIGLALMMIGYFYIIFEINVFDINSYLNLKEQAEFNIGDFLTVVSALLFAIHIIVVNRFIKDEDPVQVLIMQLLSAAVLGIIYNLVCQYDFQIVQFKNTLDFLPSFAYLIVLSSIICFGGQLVFQKYTDSASAGILMSLESAFASIFAVMFGYDPFYSGLFLGGVLVIFGVITAETNLSFILKNKKA